MLVPKIVVVLNCFIIAKTSSVNFYPSRRCYFNSSHKTIFFILCYKLFHPIFEVFTQHPGSNTVGCNFINCHICLTFNLLSLRHSVCKKIYSPYQMQSFVCNLKVADWHIYSKEFQVQHWIKVFMLVINVDGWELRIDFPTGTGFSPSLGAIANGISIFDQYCMSLTNVVSLAMVL